MHGAHEHRRLAGPRGKDGTNIRLHEDTLERTLQLRPSGLTHRRIEPDDARIHQEQHRQGVTLQLLWERISGSESWHFHLPLYANPRRCRIGSARESMRWNLSEVCPPSLLQTIRRPLHSQIATNPRWGVPHRTLCVITRQRCCPPVQENPKIKPRLKSAYRLLSDGFWRGRAISASSVWLSETKPFVHALKT